MYKQLYFPQDATITATYLNYSFTAVIYLAVGPFIPLALDKEHKAKWYQCCFYSISVFLVTVPCCFPPDVSLVQPPPH